VSVLLTKPPTSNHTQIRNTKATLGYPTECND